MASPRLTLPAVLLHHGLKLLRNSVITALVILGGSFLIHNKYTAATVLLSPQYVGDVSGLLSTLSGTSQLTRALGLEAGGGTDLYIGVLHSDSIKGLLVSRFNLVHVYHQTDEERATRKLASHTSIQLTDEGFVRVAVTEPDRRLAADLANAYAEELDHFLRENSRKGAGQRREFLERRIADTRDTLTRQEDALRDYQIRHKIPAMGADVERAAQVGSELMAAKVTREIELGTLKDIARNDDPRAEELRAQLRQIDEQLTRIPPATTDMARLYRGVRMQERVLLVLTEEYERARVLEMKNIAAVQIVDRARPPLHKSQPRRTLIAAAALVLVFAGNTVLVWAREGALTSA